MKAHDIRLLRPAELTQRIEEMRAECYALAAAVRLGKEHGHARLQQLRRDIARALTVLREQA